MSSIPPVYGKGFRLDEGCRLAGANGRLTGANGNRFFGGVIRRAKRLKNQAENRNLLSSLPPSFKLPFCDKSFSQILVNQKQFFNSDTLEVASFRAAFEEAIIFFLKKETPVFLEQFGILLPRLVTVKNSVVHKKSILIREEENLSIDFEKCENLVWLAENLRYRAIGTKEILAVLAKNLPTELQICWKEEDLRQLVLSFLNLVRHEVIELGTCARLSKIGVFFALHNRQGTSFEDWFAGADIILIPAFEETFKVRRNQVYERPILENAWEPFLALEDGDAIKRFELDIADTLKVAGLDGACLQGSKIRVGVFKGFLENSLIFCSDGLRNLMRLLGKPAIELTFQLQISADESTKKSIPEWPLLLFAEIALGLTDGRLIGENGALFASLLEGNKITLPDGLGQCLLLNSPATMKNEQLDSEGGFFYRNMVAISQDEFAFGRKFGGMQLNGLLEKKGLNQRSVLKRRSIVLKSSLSYCESTNHTASAASHLAA